jgi:hypothetical protein
MSDDARARNTARETKIWVPFVRSYPFNATETAERIIIFGMFANSYLNGQNYLKQIEDAELANLLTDYNSKLSELTNQETIIVADIVSKRYLAGIDKLVHDQKMVTAQEKIDMENALASAKYAALATDRAALTTMSAKVTAETLKNNARITELEALIEIEGINLSEVELEILKKELDSLRVDNQKLEMANEILRIQIQTVRTATELLDIDVQMARTQVDIAETERAIAKIGLLADDLTLAQAQTTIDKAQIPISEARITLARAKVTDIEAELDYITGTLRGNEGVDYANKEALLNLKDIIRQYELERREAQNELDNDLKENASESDITIAEINQDFQPTIDALQEAKYNQSVSDHWRIIYATLAALEDMVKADITTTLSHIVKKQEPTT